MSHHRHPPQTARLSDEEQRERLAGLMLVKRALTPDAFIETLMPRLARPESPVPRQRRPSRAR